MSVNVVMIEVGMAMELMSTVRQSRMKIQTMSDASKRAEDQVFFQRLDRLLDVGGRSP